MVPQLIKSLDGLDFGSGPVGAPNDHAAPKQLRTMIKIVKPFGSQLVCFGICSFNVMKYAAQTTRLQKDKNRLLNMAYSCRDNAWKWPNMPLAMTISNFDRLLEHHVPHIGQPVTYGKSPSGKEKKCVRLEAVTYWRDRYPLLVIPTTSEGVCSHIFWMIDDLIFDTSTGHALKRI